VQEVEDDSDKQEEEEDSDKQEEDSDDRPSDPPERGPGWCRNPVILRLRSSRMMTSGKNWRICHQCL